MATYNADYFLKKFGPKPARLWCTRAFQRGKKYWALGYCGARTGRSTPESRALDSLFCIQASANVWCVNDSRKYARNMRVSYKESRQGPRARIMAALRIIKAKGG